MGSDPFCTSLAPQKRVIKMKNILMLRSSIGVFGAEQVILELAKSLQRSGHTPIIGVVENSDPLYRELADAATRAGLPNVIFKCRRRFDLATIASIRKFVKQKNVAVVHSHGYKADFYAFFSTLFSKAKTISTCHPWLECETSHKAKLYTSFDKYLLKRFSKIVAISPEINEELTLSGISQNKIRIIENGIDCSRFGDFEYGEIRRSLGISDGATIIGTIGRLSPEKGHLILLKAAKSLVKAGANINFIIVGDGESREQLENFCLDNELQQHIHFTGVRNDIPELLAVFDIFVLPSLTEGLPMALLEAMAAGKPVIASATGSIPTVIEDGKSGILVPAGNVSALENGLIKLLFDLPSAQQMGQHAGQRIRNRYSSARMADEYMTIYEQL